MPGKFLYFNVYESILSSITRGEYLSGMMLPSESELCKKFDVSLITVRRALQDLEDYGIVSKVKGKGTLVNNGIRKNNHSSNKNIGVLDIPNLTQCDNRYPIVPFDSVKLNQNDWKNLIYSSLYKSLIPDYNLILGNYTKEELLNNFEHTVFDTIDRIFVIGLYDKEIIEFLHSKDKLVLVYNNFDKNVEVCSVSSNERAECCGAVEELIKLGHKKIAAINGDISFSESVERSMGYQEAFMKNNMPVDGRLMKWGNMTSESGYHLMKKMLEEGQNPTAVVCVNDNVAAGAQIAINELGLSCPEDISVIGHDNNKLLFPHVNPKLSSVDPHYDNIGAEVARKIVRNIWIDDSTVVKCDFIIGNSVGRAKTAV